MAITKLADIIEPSTYLRYQSEYRPEKFDLLASSAISAPEGEVAAQLSAGGTIIDMPYWFDVDRSVPNIPSDNEATIATPAKMTSYDMKARKIFWHKSWSAARLAGVVATGNPGDPLRKIVDFTTNYWRYQTQNAIIKTLDGVLADNTGNDSSDMLYSVYSDVASPVAANKISYAAINRARLTAGEFLNDMGIIVVHSKVYGDMLDQQGITFVMPKDFPYQISMFGGMQVVVSDMCTVTTGSNSSKYRSYIMGAGAIAMTERLPEDAVATQREEDQGNGGGVDYLHNRRYMIVHPFGFSMISGSVSGKYPTHAELATAGNWNRVAQRNNIPIAWLETN
jgi:Major capsid protein 13-like